MKYRYTLTPKKHTHNPKKSILVIFFGFPEEQLPMHIPTVCLWNGL